ncbi:MAG: dienelactone hydrolase family protein [Opitutaceae bacterium]
MNLKSLVVPLATMMLLAACTPEMRVSAETAITVNTHEYTIADEVYEGCVARPAAEKESYPAVMVVHDWMGNGEFSRAQAERLARLGYIAFAVDLYGKGVRATDAAGASKLAGRFYQSPPLFRGGMVAALEEMKKLPGVDTTKLGAIGFCFGGTAVLELARSGADIAGVVSFHGGLKPFSTQRPEKIVPKILILHGAIDPHVSPDDVAACMSELNEVGVAYRLVAYPKTVHAFTNPAAGDDPSTGAAYQEEAAKAAFEEMERFFLYIFK